MEELLKNSTLLLAIVTLLYVVIAGITMTERMRIMLVYIFSWFLALASSIRLLYVSIGAVAVLLLGLEFLSDDTMRLQLFTRARDKVADFLYRIFVEHAFAYFILAMAAIFVSHRWQSFVLVHISALIVAFGSMALALLSLTAQVYVTKSITEIIQRLEGKKPIYQLKTSPHARTLFAILVSMEDRAYFERNDDQHTIPFGRLLTKGLQYVRDHKGAGVTWAIRSLFSRGYGTIEMQLLRSIGIEFGYRHTYRRKVFEWLYANLLFNSYRRYLARRNVEYDQYREFVIEKYIDNVDVKINGHPYRSDGKKSSLLRLSSRRSLERVTREEFFVWCLGLPQLSYIYPATIDFYYDDLMQRFGIDRAVVGSLLAELS